MTSRWRRTMLKPRQKNEDGLDVREANHRMMNMLAILLALFHRNFSKFSDQGVRGAVTKFENQIMAAIELLRTMLIRMLANPQDGSGRPAQDLLHLFS